MLRNFTVIFRDDAGDLLVYWLTLPEGYTKKAVIIACAVERMADIEADLGELGVIAQGITVELVYPGHIDPASDWRE